MDIDITVLTWPLKGLSSSYFNGPPNWASSLICGRCYFWLPTGLGASSYSGGRGVPGLAPPFVASVFFLLDFCIF